MFAEINLNLYEFYKSVFTRLKHFQINGFSELTMAALKAQSLKISEIARNLPEKMPFHSKRTKTERFLNNERVKTSELQRQYLNYLFKMFFSFSRKIKVKIIVDYTDFHNCRILHAGIPCRGRVFPIFFKAFSIKETNDYSLKNVEETFLRILKELLPLDYEYILIADRGFGNERFINLCESIGFFFVLRIKQSFHVLKNNKRIIASDVKDKLNKDVDYKGHKLGLVITEENDQKWYLLTNLQDLRVVKGIYEERFWTEEYFRDLKHYFQGGNLRYNMAVLKKLLLIGQICYNFVFDIGLKENIDISQLSASPLSFFPQGFLAN